MACTTVHHRQIAPGLKLGREFGIAQDHASDAVQPIDGTHGEHAEGLTVSASRPFHECCLHAPLHLEATDLVAMQITAETAGWAFNLRLPVWARLLS